MQFNFSSLGLLPSRLNSKQKDYFNRLEHKRKEKRRRLGLDRLHLCSLGFCILKRRRRLITEGNSLQSGHCVRRDRSRRLPDRCRRRFRPGTQALRIGFTGALGTHSLHTLGNYRCLCLSKDTRLTLLPTRKALKNVGPCVRGSRSCRNRGSTGSIDKLKTPSESNTCTLT